MGITKGQVKEWRKHDTIARHIFGRMQGYRQEWDEKLFVGHVTRLLDGKTTGSDQINFLLGVLFGIDLLLEMGFDDESERNQADGP